MNTKTIVSIGSALVALAAFAETEDERGLNIGQRMTLHPYVALSYTYDSNVDSGKHGKEGSQWVVNPGVGAEYRGDNWTLEGALWYQYHAYNRYVNQLNSSSYGESLKFNWSNSMPDEKGWRVMLSEKFHQIAQDDDMTEHNGRGIGRDRKQFAADGIIQRRLNETMHLDLIGSYYFLEYDNNVDKYAALYGWKRTSVGAEFGFAPSKWTDIIIHGDYQWYSQDNDKDLDAWARGDVGARGRTIRSDSRGYTLMAGLASKATERISYRALAGWSKFEYGDGVKDCDGFVYQASMNWTMSETLNMMLLGSSYYQPSEREYGSAIKVYTVSWGLGKSFIRGKLTGTIDVAYRKETHEYVEYAEDDYDEDIFTARVGLNYRLNRYLDIYGRLEYQDEETEGGGPRNHQYDYDRVRATVGMRLTY